MERNSLSNSLKDHIIGSRAMRDYNSSSNNNNQNNKKLKDSWNCNSQSYGEDYLSGFSWPPRSYTCSFCKREFRSAQALGGHMNVHRRDRARLRQSSPIDGQCPILNLNLSPYPSTNFSSSSSSSSPSSPLTSLPSFSCTLPSLVSPDPLSSLSSPSSPSPSKMRKWGLGGTLSNTLSPRGLDLGKTKSAKSIFGVEEFDDFMQEDEYNVLKKSDIVRLDLEIGVLSASKEDLDLELRLGYS